MEEKYYGVYDGKELKAVGLKQQCDKYSIDRRLLSTRLVEVEPDWNNETFMKNYLLSDELYECPLTETEYKVLFDLECIKINNRKNVIENIEKVLNEKTLKETYRDQYKELYEQVKTIYSIEMQNFKEDFEDLIKNYDLKDLVESYSNI